MTAQYDVSVEDIEYLKAGEASLLARLYRPKSLIQKSIIYNNVLPAAA